MGFGIWVLGFGFYPESRYTSQTANAQAIAVTIVTITNAQTKFRRDDKGPPYRFPMTFSSSSEVNGLCSTGPRPLRSTFGD